MKTKTPNKRYSAEQIEFLRAGYPKMKVEDLTERFNRKFGQSRSVAAIKTVLGRRKIKCGRPYGKRLINTVRIFEPEHVDFLVENYPKHRIPELTERLNEAFGLGVTKRQVKTCLANRRITCKGKRTGRFEKGTVPWNKGVKGSIKPNSGNFRKGNVPANVRPLWSERIGKNGYVEMKVPERDPYTGFATRYKQKHVWIWERRHGRKAPKGHAVIFVDGDIANFDPDNLLLVTRAELLALNHHDYKNQPAEIKPSILALARLEAKAGIRTRPTIGRRKACRESQSK